MSSSKKIILFDGVCNLCNGAVQFVIKHDHQEHFLFASLQSAYGQQQLIKHGFQQTLNTIILLDGEEALQKSDAILGIVRHLPGAWSFLYTLKMMPRFIRDATYDWVARNRYLFFGRMDACMIPTPELKARFID